jgi:hypothetical protein
MRVGLKESIKAAGDRWDWGDDAIGIIPILVPFTALWYLFRGVPSASAEPRPRTR